jgi:thioredoxin reductase
MHAPWPFGRREATSAWPPLLAGVSPDGATPMAGVLAAGHVVLDVPGLAAAVADGARVGGLAAARLAGTTAAPAGTPDLAVVGAGPAGCAIALAAGARGLRVVVLEAAEPFASLTSAPDDGPFAGVPTPAGAVLRATAEDREALLAELRAQVGTLDLRPGRVVRLEPGPPPRVLMAGGAALDVRTVVLATGRFGCPRRLGVPGDDAAHVRHAPARAWDHAGRRVLVVGGGECAAAIALRLAEAGAEVTLAHRGAMLTRPDHATLARLSERLAGAPLEPWRKRRTRSEVARRAPGPGTIALRLVTQVLEIRPASVVLREGAGTPVEVGTDDVFVAIGRHSPAELAEASGLPLAPAPGDRD